MNMVGLVLIGVGVFDTVLGLFVIGPRIPDPKTRKVVQRAIVAGALMCFAIGSYVLLESQPPA